MAGTGRMRQPSVAELIEIHRRAYRLLMWINDEAAQEPAWLSPDSVGRMGNRSGCEQWLRENASNLPSRFVPEDGHVSAFAGILASFLETSFGVERMEVGGELVEARLRRRRHRIHGGRHNMMNVVAAALRHVLSRDGVRLTSDEAGRLARRESLRNETRIVAYVWELGRRARGKSKGAVIHRLWRSIPVEVRTTLDESGYWLAKTRVLEAIEAGK